MDASKLVLQHDELWNNNEGHDKLYKLAILLRGTQYEVWSFYKARKASKWNFHCHFTGNYEHSANIAYAQQFKSKTAKGYHNVKNEFFDLPKEGIYFLSDVEMLEIAGIKIDPDAYECIDDFAEKRGFAVGCEYYAIDVNDAEGKIKVQNDAGETHELPLNYFRKVG